MIEKLVLGGIWTEDLPIFNPDALISVPSRQAKSSSPEAVIKHQPFAFSIATS